jgi:enoyl-CoA hydratase/carnithine racemase
MSELDISEADGVLTLTLCRPQKKNALTSAMYEGMIGAFAHAAKDASIGAILLRGNEGMFTAGNDIGDFIAALKNPQDLAAMPFVEALAMNDVPLVAAIEGVAVGIGTTLMLHCDLVYAAPDVKFRMPFVDLGLVPEAGSSLLLPQRIGMARASELLLLGEAFGAEEAERFGLINAIVPARELYRHAHAKAKALADKPQQALRAARQLMRGERSVLRAQMGREAEAFRSALQSTEAQRAFAAFFHK